MYATKIKMKNGCQNSSTATEISEIYIMGCPNPGYFSKSYLYDYLKTNPGTIKVNLYPYLIPALSNTREKYVRSKANDTPNDNLLKLPSA